MTSHIRILALAAVSLLALAAVGPGARYIEEIAVGGGFGDPTDGGAEIDRTGAIATDGAIEARGGAGFGESDGAHAVAVTAGAGAEAALALYENDALNGARLWYDGAANALKLGTHDNSATPTPALQVEQGSPDVEVLGGLVVASSLDIGSNSRISETVDSTDLRCGTSARVQFYFGTTERYRMTTSSFHARNSETLGLATRRWGNLYTDNAVIGYEGFTRGVLEIAEGGDGDEAAVIQLHSKNGTVWHLFVEDDGTLRVSSSLPDSDDDGTVVGSQF